jgi:hypothetical protein
MANTMVSNTTPTKDEIAARAYEIYLREGSVPGRDLDHWLKAEEELRASATNVGSANGSNGISHAKGNGNGQSKGNGRGILDAPSAAARTPVASPVASPTPVIATAARTTSPKRATAAKR